MSTIKSIRLRLNLSQAELGVALGCTQGNVSFYEKGQTVPPETAGKLIEFARKRGLELTFDHVYGAAELPPEQQAAEGAGAAIPNAAAA